jgi:hypothetical protein
VRERRLSGDQQPTLVGADSEKATIWNQEQHRQRLNRNNQTKRSARPGQL